MVTFRMNMVELIRQNRGPVSAIRLQVAAIQCDECGAIPYEEFQVKYTKLLLLNLNEINVNHSYDFGNGITNNIFI